MLFSKIFIPTLREIPAEAEAASHVLMLRAGYVRQLASGLYIYLPLAWRVMDRINRIIRKEMNAIGAQELSMPALHPAEIWEKTGRWHDIGEEMFRLRDRGGRDMCLGMTHEEIITWLASMEIRSYRDLPQIWYQLQTKFRDEARPKSGILRTREFIMKDSYSFDRDEEGLEASYGKHAEAYHRIFTRCGLKYFQVESDPGMMGGATAHEFMAPSPAGEDTIVLCDSCGYAANTELALSVPPAQGAHAGEKEEDVATPGKKTVTEVAGFLKAGPERFIKSLVLIDGNGPFLALVRGDQELHEKKLQRIVGEFRPARREEVRDILGVEAGFIGPQGRDMRIIADASLREGVYISGANREGYHRRGIKPGLHFDAEWKDIHIARGGDGCPTCGALLREERVIEIGNIFKLGTKYSVPLKAVYLDEQGQERPVIMGSYGIGPARIAAAAIEQNSDKEGIVWPRAIAPFDVEVVPLSRDDREVWDTAMKIEGQMQDAGLDVLFDDRDERPGVKFKDADLLGIPCQVIVGKKGLQRGVVEFKVRKTMEKEEAAPSDVTARVRAVFEGPEVCPA
ncbi:MAG: proline--tRNA ligase [Nitrospiraceae bacterium]|nr:MAG: proline--tRNA ligase [Nitrospiraceae bacterium]